MRACKQACVHANMFACVYDDDNDNNLFTQIQMYHHREKLKTVH